MKHVIDPEGQRLPIKIDATSWAAGQACMGEWKPETQVATKALSWP